MKANHNSIGITHWRLTVVASTTKIQKWKQITTQLCFFSIVTRLLPVRQRYKNESKSQRSAAWCPPASRCCQYDKDTKMKANHNPLQRLITEVVVVASTTKIQKWKQITTTSSSDLLAIRLLPVRQRYKNESKSQLWKRTILSRECCCQYDKDTKMKANHNVGKINDYVWKVVASTTKIQKWKQITT